MTPLLPGRTWSRLAALNRARCNAPCSQASPVSMHIYCMMLATTTTPTALRRPRRRAQQQQPHIASGFIALRIQDASHPAALPLYGHYRRRCLTWASFAARARAHTFIYSTWRARAVIRVASGTCIYRCDISCVCGLYGRLVGCRGDDFPVICARLRLEAHVVSMERRDARKNLFSSLAVLKRSRRWRCDRNFVWLPFYDREIAG